MPEARTYSTNLFTWDKVSATFWTCASDLGVGVLEQPFGWLYLDSTEMGFWMVSAKTGKRLAAVLDYIQVPYPEKMKFWRYTITDGPSTYHVVVYNT